MMKFGVLDVAAPSPMEMIFMWPFTMIFVLALLVIGGLIYVFIRNNRDKKMIDEFEEENKDENE